MAKRTAQSTAEKFPKTLLLGIYTPFNQIGSQEYYFEEFLSLVKTSGIHYDDTLFMKLRSADNNMFLTKGKLEEVRAYCTEHEIEEVLCSENLHPLQERNLSDALSCEVHDREHLILTIFRNSATTSEGKIQVEMAELEYLKTRIIGKGEEFAQQAGYLGNKGPGETAKEVLKRFFSEKKRQAQKRLDTLERSREVQRKQRLGTSIPLVCIIGYTNSGKSSLLNRIAKSDVLAEDKLFATLDTTTRELFIKPEKKLLISDTVGFISQLPHNLIEAFKSTLAELKYGHLLLHVVDMSNPAWKDQIAIVKTTLEELGAQDKPMLYVFNKRDKLTDTEFEALKPELKGFEPHVVINTLSKEGVADLMAWIEKYKFQI
ncbi:GTPase HflX [Candidatus Dependentiae bacterium]|nr:GTPase HflX [Candidatus Dependentiae bacterium]